MSVRVYLLYRGRQVPVEVRGSGDGSAVRVGERELRVGWQELSPGVAEATVEGVRLRFCYARQGDMVQLHLAGRTYTFTRTREEVEARGARPEQDVRAPMPGLLTRVLVEPGQVVAAGQPLYVVEAMKMETVVRAARPARVLRVLAREGEQVEGGAVVVELEEDV